MCIQKGIFDILYTFIFVNTYLSNANVSGILEKSTNANGKQFLKINLNCVYLEVFIHLM